MNPKRASPYKKKKSHTSIHELCLKSVENKTIVQSEAIMKFIMT